MQKIIESCFLIIIEVLIFLSLSLCVCIFRFEWDKLLENVHCLIISVTKTDKQEAYILRWAIDSSEDRIVMTLWSSSLQTAQDQQQIKISFTPLRNGIRKAPGVIRSDITAKTDLKINCECCAIRKCSLKKLHKLQMSFHVIFKNILLAHCWIAKPWPECLSRHWCIINVLILFAHWPYTLISTRQRLSLEILSSW